MPGRKRGVTGKQSSAKKKPRSETAAKKVRKSPAGSKRAKKMPVSSSLDVLQIGVWQWDIKSNIVTWSDNAYRVFEKSDHPFDGTFESYLQTVLPEDVEKLKNAIDESLRLKKNHFVQHRIRWRDGSIHWIEGIGKVVLDKNGNALRMLGTVQDITDYKANDQDNEDWKTRYELITSASAQVAYDYFIPTGKIVWSGTVEEVLHYTADEMGDIDNWIELIHPEDRPEAIRKLDDAEKNLDKYDVSYRFKTKDGTYILMHDRGFFMADANGKASRMLGTMQDISEIKHQEEQISQREQSYRELFDAVAESIYIHAPDGVFLDVNQGACKMYGYEKHEFIGKGPDFISAPGLNDFSEAQRKLGLALAGHPQSFEWWGQRKDGSVFLKQVQLVQGTYFGKPVILATAWDITHLRQAENVLRESEARFRNLISNLNIGILLQGPDAEVIVSNKTSRELLGLTEDQLLNKEPRDSGWHVIREDGTPFPDAEYPVPLAIASRKPVRGVMMGVHRPKQKDLVWLLVNAEPILNADGSILEVICTFTDITVLKAVQQELRESEQRFRTLQRASFGGIGLHDQGLIVDCNQGLADLTGYTYEELIGMNGISLIAPAWHHVVINNIREGYEEPYDVEGIRKDGTHYFMEVHAKNIPYHGKTIRVTEFRDITYRKIAEEKIFEQNARLHAIMDDLKRKNEQLEEFTQIVSHNLRSPVGNILTLLSFLEGAEAETEREEYIKLLKESGTTTLNTLHELNEVLKIKQNKNIGKQHLSFVETYMHIRSMVSAKITETNALINCDFDEAPTIEYPRIYLESILLNLLSNALKYVYPGRQPIIYLKTYKKNNNTYLQVSDNGLGINLERYGHQVFKLRKTFHRHPESRGIGLFMIKNQIEAMGGEITLSSKENEGTQFIINLNKNLTDGN
jgi:PAS domain S-box-containing protein